MTVYRLEARGVGFTSYSGTTSIRKLHALIKWWARRNPGITLIVTVERRNSR